MPNSFFPEDHFPALSALLARRYSYLSKGLIRYRGAMIGAAAAPGGSEWTLLDMSQTDEHVRAIIASGDHAAPYRARFPDLAEDVNDALTRQVDLQLVEAWPQPTTYVALGPEEGQGRRPRAPCRRRGSVVGQDRPTEPTDVTLRRIGSAQLWWAAAEEVAGSGAPPGLIWEAVLSERAGGRSPRLFGRSGLDPSEDPLAVWLWKTCEDVLAGRGARSCLTTTRDPAYNDAGFQRFLAGRGYHTPGAPPLSAEARANPGSEPSRPGEKGFCVWAQKSLEGS